MRKIYYIILIVLLFLNIPFWALVYTSVGISLIYETDDIYDINECISNITGRNLCLIQNIATSLIITSFVILVILFYFKKRIIK